MSDGHPKPGSYEEFAEKHELLPKWAKFVSDTLGPKPTDSKLATGLKIVGILSSPLWAGTGSLAAYAHDKIMYHPYGLGGIPGYGVYKINQLVNRPPQTPPIPVHRPPQVTVPLRPAPPPPPIIRTAPPIKPYVPPPLPPKPVATSVSNRSFVNNLRVMEPSWKLKLDSTLAPKPSWMQPFNKLTLTPPSIQSPYRPYSANIGFKTGTLKLGGF